MQPEQTPRLAAALAKVQSELPKLERDRTVTVEPKDPKKDTYSYSYATLANLSETILPLLGKHGLAFAAMPGSGSDGKMCVRYHLMHESGETLSGEFPISGEGGIQMIGGRITYARRYCLAAVVGVAADEDDESRLSDDGAPGTAQRSQQRRQQQPPAERKDQPSAQRSTASAPPGNRPPLPGAAAGLGITAPQRAKILAAFSNMGLSDRDERLQLSSRIVNRRLASANELTKAEAKQLIDALEEAVAHPEPAKWLREMVASLPVDGDDSEPSGGEA